MRVVGLGIQDFEKIRRGNQFYIDKTGFISAWYRGNDDVTLITRPRRFGKTLTMDMLDCFFSTVHAGRSDLFEGLAISRDREMMELQGTVPTIWLSFSSVKADTFYGFLLAITGRIGRLLTHYRYLLQGDALTEEERKLFLEMSKIVPEIPDREREKEKYLAFLFKLTHILQFLSRWLEAYHGRKPFIFLDEYDTPIQAAYLNHYYDEAISIMREMFSETFKENEFLDRAVITGITRIAKESLFSGMNNLAVCSVMSPKYNRTFGFTREEMDDVLREYGLLEQKDLVRFWYDGFTFGGEAEIYNPWSVINYLSHKDSPPSGYWSQSGGLGLIDHLLKKGGSALKEGFEILLGGGAIEKFVREDLIFPQLDGDENAVWSLLIAAGYLKPVPSEDSVAENCPARRMAPGAEGYTYGQNARTPEGTALLWKEQAAEEPVRQKTRLVLTNYETRQSLCDMVTDWFETPSGNHMERFAEALVRDDSELTARGFPAEEIRNYGFGFRGKEVLIIK